MNAGFIRQANQIRILVSFLLIPNFDVDFDLVLVLVGFKYETLCYYVGYKFELYWFHTVKYLGLVQALLRNSN
jgi:hypothetical protein